MSIKPFIAITVFSFLFFTCSCQRNSRAAPQIEKIIQQPEKFAGNRIDIHSCFRSNRHGIAILDCDNPELLLPIRLSTEAAASSSAKLLLDAGYRQWPPGSQVRIKAQFEGVLLDRRAEGEGFDFLVDHVAEIEVHEEHKKFP